MPATGRIQQCWTVNPPVNSHYHMVEKKMCVCVCFFFLHLFLQIIEDYSYLQGTIESKMAVRDWSKTYKDMDGDISDPKNN